MRKLFIGFVVGAVASGLLTTKYSAPGNAGVVVGVEQAHIGYEYRGEPGWFVGVGGREVNPGR